jgi:hypothetical protein
MSVDEFPDVRWLSVWMALNPHHGAISMAIENVKKIQRTHDSRMVNALLKAGGSLWV